MYGLKCLIAAAIDSASISHGNQVTRRPPSLAPKKPASFSVPFCLAYIVALMPHSFTDPSIAIHSSFSGHGRAIVLFECSLSSARLKASSIVSVHCMLAPLIVILITNP